MLSTQILYHKTLPREKETKKEITIKILPGEHQRWHGWDNQIWSLTAPAFSCAKAAGHINPHGAVGT